ncbi:uncharacterized protein LOC143527334 [Brachyhypopomus gauderio]|uniref:uncharacterized protein LOC143527334 n=1 Tax=Brachyhypopomus gauderio TaxID=698409 RepID=UPI00404243DA
MEGSRVVLITLTCVVFSSQKISGADVEMRVRRGENVTLHVWNPSNQTHDLLVKNMSESVLGLYYCALHMTKITKDENGVIISQDVYYYGNRTIRLSLHECGVCWTLLITVCPVCVLLSSLLSSTCVYCLCHKRHTGSKKTNENIFQVICVEEHQCEWSVNGEICYHTEISYTPLRSTLKSD